MFVNSKGNAMLWVVMTCSVITVCVTAYASTVTRDVTISVNEYGHMTAFHGAQAGLECAMDAIEDDHGLLNDFIDLNLNVSQATLSLYPDTNNQLSDETEQLLAALHVTDLQITKEFDADQNASFFAIFSKAEVNRSVASVKRLINLAYSGHGGGSCTHQYPIVVEDLIHTTQEKIILSPGSAIYDDTLGDEEVTILDIFTPDAFGNSLILNTVTSQAPLDLPPLVGDKELILNNGIYMETDAKDLTMAKSITGSGLIYYNGNLDFNGGLNARGLSPDQPIIIIVEDSIVLNLNSGITLENAALIVKGSIDIAGQGHGDMVNGFLAAEKVTTNQELFITGDQPLESTQLMNMSLDIFPFNNGPLERFASFGDWLLLDH